MSSKSQSYKNISVTVGDTIEESKAFFRHNLEESANKAILKDGQFRIGVSGGSLVKSFAEILPAVKSDFSKWKIFFCDERIVPFDDPESTYGLYKQILFGKSPLNETNFIPVNTNLSAHEAAIDYEKKLRQHFPYEFQDPDPNYFPRFDCLLLGLGPDGHTCSLFPGHPLLKEKKLWIAPITDSPKPPPQRVTITFPVIHNARSVILYLIGEGKADIVKRILLDCEKLPGFYINTTHPANYCNWILDAGSSKYLPEHEPYMKQLAEYVDKYDIFSTTDPASTNSVY